MPLVIGKYLSRSQVGIIAISPCIVFCATGVGWPRVSVVIIIIDKHHTDAPTLSPSSAINQVGQTVNSQTSNKCLLTLSP